MSKKVIKALIASSEANPFVKTGGLADVVEAFPKYLKNHNVEASVVIPKYSFIDFSNYNLELVLSSMCVKMGVGEEWCSVYKTKTKSDITYYFIEHHRFFSREGLYHDNNFNDYNDNPYRFGFFSKAVLQMCKDLKLKPDIIHANDWQTALIPAYIKLWHWNDEIGKSASVLTIHNANYQGIYNSSCYDYLGLGRNNFSSETFEDHGNINMLKGGIFFADFVTTVSKNYAKEISSPYGGSGLAPYLANKTVSFVGIKNGIDTSLWSPQNDKYIPQKFSIKSMRGKKKAKEEAQKTFLLEENTDILLMGFVGRLVDQKGVSLITNVIDRVLINMSIQFILIGVGDSYYEDFFKTLPKYYQGRVGTYIGYNEKLSHILEAGCDVFLMPSLFEPCGLNQMYSQIYGTLPIVHATGGLDDTVLNCDEKNETGNGFKFYDATPLALYNTIGWAVSIYYDRPKLFKKMQKEAMSLDNSWENSIIEYLKAYKKSIANKKIYDKICK